MQNTTHNTTTQQAPKKMEKDAETLARLFAKTIGPHVQQILSTPESSESLRAPAPRCDIELHVADASRDFLDALTVFRDVPETADDLTMLLTPLTSLLLSMCAEQLCRLLELEEPRARVLFKNVEMMLIARAADPPNTFRVCFALSPMHVRSLRLSVYNLHHAPAQIKATTVLASNCELATRFLSLLTLEDALALKTVSCAWNGVVRAGRARGVLRVFRPGQAFVVSFGTY